MPRADGSILISTSIDVSRAEKDLAKLKDSISKTESELEEMSQERSEAQEKSIFSAAELDAEKAKLEEMKRQLAEIRAIARDTTISPSVREEAKTQIPVQQADIADQQTRVRMLQAEFNRAASAVEKYDSKIKSATKKLERQQKEAGELAKDIASVSRASIAMEKAQDRAAKSMNRFALRLREVMRSALIFTLITQTLAKFRDWMGKVIKTNAEASASIARLKGALLTLAQPLVQVLIPAFIALVNVLTKVVSVAAQIVSMLFGRTAKQSAEAAAALNEQTNALEGVGKAAEESAGSMAAFDEINQLSGGKEAGGGVGGGADTIEPDFQLDTQLPEEQLRNILGLVEAIGSALLAWKISSALGGGLSTFLLSLALVASAIEFVKAIFDAWTNGVSTENLIKSFISLGVAAAALYALLGPVAAGIGLIVGGIAMLVTGFKDAAENGWNLQNTLMAMAGLFAAGLGISLLTGSFIPALIGGIAALVLAFVVLMGHGEELVDGLKKIFGGLVDFFVGIFTGDIQRAMDGVSLVFEGLKNVVFSIFNSIQDVILGWLDWLDEITFGQFSGIIEIIKNLVIDNFTTIKNFVSSIIDSLQQILNGFIKFISGVFSADWKRVWEGIRDIFKGIINGIIGIFEGMINLIIDGINGFISMLNGMIRTAVSALAAIGIMVDAPQIPLIERIQLPRLATGAVIPPNKEFLAVLGDQKSGTNIEAPLDTIVQAFRMALGEMGGGGNGEAVMVLDGEVVGRLTYDLYNRESKRVGVSLAGGNQ